MNKSYAIRIGFFCCLILVLFCGLRTLLVTTKSDRCYMSAEIRAKELYDALKSLSKDGTLLDVFTSVGGLNPKTSTEYFKMLDSSLKNQTNTAYSFSEMAAFNCYKLGRTSGVGWSVIKNLPSNPPMNLPLLVSRNIDVLSLTNHVDNRNTNMIIRFSNSFTGLLDQQIAMVVYYDGRVMRFRRKDGVSYYEFYRKRPISLEQECPLKYLTP